MDLCTATNEKYITSVINLINSYKINSYNKNIFVYCFDMDGDKIKILSENNKHINFLTVPKICEHAYHPTVFFYKTYAINDCINKSNAFIYSDATNVFNKFEYFEKYLIDDSLLLPCNNEILTNKYWTTQKCFEKMDCQAAKNTPQYWAGLQAYISTNENKKFVQKMYEYMIDPEIALPDTSVKYPNGEKSPCIEHRQDQSVLSLLIDKYNRHQKYNEKRQSLFGDWMTFKMIDQSYQHDIENCIISPRESKFGYYRFL
jgi:hypothetical protein